MKPWTRRQILKWGLIGAGVTSTAIAGQTWIRRSTSRVRIPELPETKTDHFNPYPGEYMFHPHQDAIAENGCMGMFKVIPL
ncbi:MAG: hypothetical protein RIB93_09675 [Coleofasciculus sp. D1-CHI-01]